MAKRIWITWEVQRRNQSLSTALSADLHELTYRGAAWKRYPILIFRTIRLIMSEKPDLIIAQHPSVVLAALSVIVGQFAKIKVVIDAHNAGIFPKEGRSRVMNKMAMLINARAAFVVATNEELVKHLVDHGCKAVAIPDPVPSISCSGDGRTEEDRFELVCVSSWADDEPYLEVIEAASQLGENVRIYMTGNSKGRHLDTASVIPANITLTGFISREDYDDLICRCDAVMVLTTRDNCLVCGAYEGVAVEKPMILSDTRALRKHFRKGCLYADNSAKDIARCIGALMSDYQNMQADIVELKSILQQESLISVDEFEALLHQR